MSKNKRTLPGELPLKVERTEPVETPIKCSQCGAPLVMALGSGGVNTEVTRCQQCGAQVPPPEAIREPNSNLAKIATNDRTPLCPFCKAVRIEKMVNVNFLQYRCLSCRRHFRAPVTGRRVA